VFADGSNEGNTVPLVPAHTVRGSVNLLPVNGLDIVPAVSFVSEAYQGGDNTNTGDKADAYWLADLVVHYQLPIDEDMMLVLRAENILDAVYSPYIYYDGYYPAAGRTVTLSVSYRN
jgi:iron complex outermembrane receptor protein